MIKIKLTLKILFSKYLHSISTKIKIKNPIQHFRFPPKDASTSSAGTKSFPSGSVRLALAASTSKFQVPTNIPFLQTTRSFTRASSIYSLTLRRRGAQAHHFLPTHSPLSSSLPIYIYIYIFLSHTLAH